MPQQDQAQAIRNLQTYLYQLSFHDPLLTAPPIDGIFERDTRQAVTDFQRGDGLPQTGIADQLTWERIYAAYLLSLAENSPPLRVEAFPSLPKGYRLSVGQSGFAVSVLQLLLQELEHSYGGLLPIDVSGSYTQNTAEAVREFQQHNNLPPTGEVDLFTWNSLADQHNIRYGDYGA